MTMVNSGLKGLFKARQLKATFNPYDSEIFMYKPWRSKCFVQFEIVINVQQTRGVGPVLGQRRRRWANDLCLLG